MLAGAARLAEAARGAEALAYGEDGSAAERIGQALRALQDAATLDPRLDETLSLLRSAAAEVEEAGRALSRYAGSIGGDPDRLAEVDDRVAALRSLARKHGGSLEAALARRESMKSELAGLTGAEGRRDEVAKAVAERAGVAAALAAELGQAEEKGRPGLLPGRDGGTPGARHVPLPCRGLLLGAGRAASRRGGTGSGRRGPRPPRSSSHPTPGSRRARSRGSPPGGELSRVLLAVKRALSRADPVRSYVFDEVDAGIGGAVAEAVGRALADVARDRQVICVTHLPQVAAFADRHARVEKRVTGGRTTTGVAIR